MNVLPQGRTLVIGVGNADRGDDAIGLLVARQIAQMGLPGVTVVEAAADGTELMEIWTGARSAIIIDAVHGYGNPGTIYRFDAGSSAIPAKSFRHSTHGFSLGDGIELSRVLNQLPNRLIVYGIVGTDFDLGSGISSSVGAAAREVAPRVVQELRDAQ